MHMDVLEPHVKKLALSARQSHRHVGCLENLINVTEQRMQGNIGTPLRPQSIFAALRHINELRPQPALQACCVSWCGATLVRPSP